MHNAQLEMGMMLLSRAETKEIVQRLWGNCPTELVVELNIVLSSSFELLDSFIRQRNGIGMNARLRLRLANNNHSDDLR